MATSTATILFTDVESSTELRARIGESAADRLFVDHERRLRSLVERHGGRVVKTAGDGVMAAFGSASDAILSAIDMQRATERRDEAVRLRVGIASGDVSWEGDDCFGLPVITAARLEAHAKGGQILVSQIARLLAGERAEVEFSAFGSLELKGLPTPVDAFEVVWTPAPDQTEGVPLPAMLATPAPFPFVSRQEEWAALASAWSAVRAGEGRRIALIGGEAGGGKTRLAAEFARACHDEGAAVLFGGCDAELVVPYQPWVQALDHLLRVVPVDDLDSNIAVDLATLAPLVPALARRPAPLAPIQVDADSERYRLFAAVDALLVDASRRWPLIVVLDDLQWGSAQTWALLAHIARGSAAARTMVIGTFRDVGEDINDPLASALADLRRVDTVTRVRLDGLDAAAVGALVAKTTGHDLDSRLQELVDEVTTRTLGNPFFVGEMWLHLVANDVVRRVGDRWVVSGDIKDSGVPDSIREVVAERLAHLPFSVRRLAEMVAVAGQRVEMRVIRTAADLPQNEITAGLDALATAGLVAAVSRPMLAYQFTHALVRDTVEAGIPAAARAQLHLRVAEALEAVYEGDPRPVLAELARHYCEAAGLGVAPKAVYYCRRAAEQALAAVAYEDALNHAQRALELTTPGSAQEAELLVAVGDALLRLSDFETASVQFDKAFHLARQHNLPRVAGEAAIGFADSLHVPGLPGHRAIAMVSEAIRILGDDGSAQRAQLEGLLAIAQMHSGYVDAAVATRDRALLLAHGHDDYTRGRALQAAMLTEQDPLQLIEWSRQAETAAFASGDLWSVAYATTNHMRGLFTLGRVAEVVPILDRHIEVARRVFLGTAELEEWCFRFMYALAHGRFAEAEAAAERAMEAAVGHPNLAGMYGMQMFALRREQGRLGEAAPVLELAQRNADGAGMWKPGLAMLYAELGQLDDARRTFEDLAHDDFAAVARDAVWPATGSFLAEVAIALGDVARSEVLYRDLVRFRDMTLMVGMTACLGPADRVLGGLAAVLGRDEEADEHFRAAASLAERSKSPIWMARVLHDWARYAGESGDISAGAQRAARALALAEQHGMVRLAEQCRELPAASLRSVPAPAFPDGLSAREVEVLRLVAAGRSNRDIGTALHISTNTAANHVRSILQKTGSANRAEAAAYAAKHELL